MVDNTGMSNGPSFTYNDKNQATAIGSIYLLNSHLNGWGHISSQMSI